MRDAVLLLLAWHIGPVPPPHSSVKTTFLPSLLNTAVCHPWKYARRSAKVRDWWYRGHRIGRQPTGSAYTSRNGEHDYEAYYAACAWVLGEEQNRPDFQKAVADLDRHFQAVEGPMADRTRTPLSFIERRLLDILMYWEGWSLENDQFPTA